MSYRDLHGGRRAALMLAAAVVAVSGPAWGQAAKSKTVDIPPYASAPEKLVNPPAGAALSPDGLRAAWASADGASILSATRAAPSAEWGAPNRLLTTRGVVKKIVFSPDGQSIAYENPRTWRDNGAANDSWAFIAVYDIATRKISFVDPSFDTDSDPSWSADGKSISFTRKVPGLADKHLTKPVIRLKGGAWEPPALRPGESFSMAQIMAAPYLYPLTPSADGTAIAYISREAKDRGVYLLRDGQPAQRLVNYGGDEGQDMADAPAISAHGGAVAYIHGSRMNKQGQFADPTPNVDLPVQQVWIIGTDGSDAPRLLGPGKNPMFTPDEKFVLWRSAGKIMAAALTWDNGRLKGVGNPQEFLTGTREDMRFSPDGGKVAYVRGDAVEVYDFASQIATVIPHGADVDGGPIWSPDGASIAFRREPADAPELLRNNCGQSRYCGPVVESQPWAIWTVSLSDLQHPKKIWQAKPGMGSVFYEMDQAYAPGADGAQMFWSHDGHIAFSWEGDGWRHLYSVPAKGGKAKLLTPGDGEVEYASPTVDGQGLVYATNIGDLGRRHIGQVAMDGSSAARAVTAGEGNQWDAAPMAGGKIAYVDSDWAHPETVVVKSADGTTARARFPQAPAGFPSAELVKPELVDFPASDGETSHGQLFVPKNPNGCAIIFSHGGNRRQMLTGFHYMDAYHYLYGMNQYLASRGCVVLSVEYRGSIMRGHAYRNKPGWGFDTNSQILDFVGAANWLKKRKDVDASRGLGIYGLSWGGYMTATALAMHSDIFTVGFDMAGVHITDDAAMPKTAVGMIDGWTSPVFLAQGDDDMNVNINDGIALSHALQTKRPQVEFKQQVLPGQTHDLYLSYEQLSEIYTDGSDWLLSHLGVK